MELRRRERCSLPSYLLWHSPEVLLSCRAIATAEREPKFGLSRSQFGLQAPPKPAKVPIDGVQAIALTKTVTAMRGICNGRLKIDVEYGLKRGTTDNSYLIKARIISPPSIAMPWQTQQSSADI